MSIKFLKILFIFIFPLILLQPLNAQQDSSKVDSLIAIGNKLLEKNHYKDAKEVFKEILQINPGEFRAHLGLGKTALAEKKYGDADFNFDKVFKKDPENIEAHYYKAICKREMGIYKPPLINIFFWKASRKNFEWVISQDSLYRDVFYQYAILLKDQKKYDEAIQMMLTQIRLRPELYEPRLKLFRYYRYFIANENEKKAIQWLKQQPYDEAKFFIGEKLRREGKLEQADSLFQDLLVEPLSMPKQPIYLALARIYYQLDNVRLGEYSYWQAVDQIQKQLDADLVFEDVKYIITDEELDLFRSLKSVHEWIDFFHRLWASRDPLPATENNFRLAQHYRRLVYAEKWFECDEIRRQFYEPEVEITLTLPKSCFLNEEFHDKGLIYLRHGKPDNQIATSLKTTRGYVSAESWVYYKTTTSPEMVFHFRIPENSLGCWRLSPITANRDFLEDRLTLGPEYYHLLRAKGQEKIVLMYKEIEKFKETAKAGFTTDRYELSEMTKPFDLPISLATFREPEGKTLLEVYYAVPLGTLTKAHKDSTEMIELEKGFTIYDTNWRLVEKTNDKIYLPKDKNKSFIDCFQFIVRPDSYNLSMYMNPKCTNLLGSWKFEKSIDDYSGSELKISDIQLASEVEPATRSHKFVKNDLLIVPNPTRQIFRKNPQFIYFEIYNLVRDDQGKTNYSIEYSVISKETKSRGVRKVLSLFGGGKKSTITATIDREGDSEFSAEYLQLDVSHVKTGEYELLVKVKDHHSGKEALRKINIHIS